MSRPDERFCEIKINGDRYQSNGYTPEDCSGMNVQDLIEILKTHNPKATVIFTCVHGIAHALSDEDIRIHTWDGEIVIPDPYED